MSLPEIKIINKHHLCFEENEYIGRGSPLWQEGDDIEAYAKYLLEQIQEGNQSVIDEMDRLAHIAMTKGKLILRCYCTPKPCHGDVIRKVLLEAIQEYQSPHHK